MQAYASIPRAPEEARPRWVRAAGWLAALALGLIVALTLAIAAAAAAVIGLLLAVAAMVLRFAPGRRARGAGGPPLLEGRATPEGWVAEPSGQH